MFSLDWRPNLTSTVCQGGECQELIDEGYLTPADPGDIAFFELCAPPSRRSGRYRRKGGPHDEPQQQKNCAGPETDGSGGGFIVSDLRMCTTADTADWRCRTWIRRLELADFNAALDSIPLPQGNSSHPYQGKELFSSSSASLPVRGSTSGHDGWTDFATNNNYRPQQSRRCPGPMVCRRHNGMPRSSPGSTNQSLDRDR